MLIEEHGFFGNVYIRQNLMERRGDSVGGHAHFFDHVSLLVSGSVSVTIDDKKAFTFKAPTFIVIRKNERHRITSLEDNTVWYCIFACRDIYGNTTDIADPKNDPWFTERAPADFWEHHPLDTAVSLQLFEEIARAERQKEL